LDERLLSPPLFLLVLFIFPGAFLYRGCFGFCCRGSHHPPTFQNGLWASARLGLFRNPFFRSLFCIVFVCVFSMLGLCFFASVGATLEVSVLVLFFFRILEPPLRFTQAGQAPLTVESIDFLRIGLSLCRTFIGRVTELFFVG